MSYDITENGTLNILSDTRNYFPIEEALKLPSPNGINYQIGESSVIITNEDIINTFKNKKVDALLKVLNLNENIVSFDNVDESNQQRFINLLNKHSLTRLNKGKLTETSLQNQVVDNIFKVITSAENQINLHMPIDMSIPQKAAEDSIAGEAVKHVTSDDPSTKYVMQVQNMVGKEVIGITAVSIKAFFAASTYYNNLLKDLESQLRAIIQPTIGTTINFESAQRLTNEQIAAIQRVINDLFVDILLTNPFDGEITCLGNLNFEDLFDLLNEYPLLKTVLVPTQIRNANRTFTITTDNNPITLETFLKTLNYKSMKNDITLSLSALLSASTDNAKELILSKINATSKFVDIYTYGLMLGNDFNKIADIMKSPIFNKIVKLTETNIFNPSTSKYSLKSALEFYVNNKLLPNIDSFAVIKALNQDQSNVITQNKGWEDMLFDNSKVQNAINFIANYLQVQNLDNDYYDSQENEYNDWDEGLQTLDELGIQYRNFQDQPIKQKEALDLINFFKEVLLRNEVLSTITKAQQDNLSMILNSIVPAIEEMELMGAMLGVNQGLRTNDYDMYSFIKRIENFINNRMQNEYINETKRIKAENKTLLVSQQKKLPEKPERFILQQFLSDLTVQEQWIQTYDRIKSSHNILDIITKVPHFARMFQTLSTNSNALSRYSTVYRLERQFADDVVEYVKNKSTAFDFKLTQPEFREIEKTIYDSIISGYIIQAGLKIKVPEGFTYFTGLTNQTATTTEEKILPINSLAGIANFKRLMDEVIIPQIIKQYPKNKFVQSLIRQSKLENDQIKTNWRLIFQMMNIDDTQQTQIMYNDVLNDFDAIANQTINNQKVADLFYLYNLITYKDSFGQDTFTRLFENLINSKNTTFLINNFYQYLSDLDHNVKTVDIEFDNIIARLSAINPKVKKRKGLNRVSPIKYNSSYFTFDLPFTKEIPVELIDVSKPIGNQTSLLSNNDLMSYFDIKVDNRTAIINFVNQLKQSNPNIKVQLVSNAWMNDHAWVNSDAEAFIEDGVIYINMDKASKSSLIHELGHLLFAYWKSENPTLYYQTIGLIRNSQYFNQIAALYPDSHGSDLLEEVMLKLMQMQLDNMMLENETGLWDNIMHTLYPNNSVENTLIDMAKSIIHDSLSETRFFEPDLIQKSQKSATWKDELVKTKQLTEDCSNK